MGALVWPLSNHTHHWPMTILSGPSHWHLLIFISIILSPQGCYTDGPIVYVASGDGLFSLRIFLGTHPSCCVEVVCSPLLPSVFHQMDVYSPIWTPELLLVYVVINKPAMSICGSVSV